MIPLLSGTEREDTNERVHGTETDSQPWITRWVPKEPTGAGGTGGLGLASAHGVHGMTGQQEPVVEPREL